MDSETKKNSKVWTVIIILIVLGIYIYDSSLAKKAQDYYSACVNLYLNTNAKVGANLDYHKCSCVSNLYYNDQLIRKLGLMEKLPTCD